MNANMIINLLSKKNKGQFFKATYISDVPMTASAKRSGHVVLKYTSGTFRWGIKYSNLKNVKVRDEAAKMKGETISHELTWGTWSTEHPDLVIEHKGIKYIRLYMTPNKSKSEYFVDGRPISIEELKNMGIVLPSYWKKGDYKPECITVKAENIQDIF